MTSVAQLADARRLRALLGALLVLALVILGVAGYLRLAADGLDCEPWPLCYGTEETAGAVNATALAGALRVAHRVAATAFALLLALWSALAWRALALRERWVAAALITVAAAFGWVGTPMPSALPWVTLAESLGGVALVAFVLALLGDGDDAPAMTRGQRLAAAGVLAALVLQVTTGVLISVRGAGSACAVACTYLWLPGYAKVFDPFTAGSAIDLVRNTAAGQPLQALHRLGGMLIALAAVGGALAAIKGRRGLRIVAAAAATALLGFAVAAYDGPVIVVVVHALAAALTVGLLVTALVRMRAPAQDR